MIVRRERLSDVPAVRAIHVAAFPAPAGVEPVEAPLLDALRVDAGWIHFQALALSAHHDGIRGRFEYAAPFADL